MSNTSHIDKQLNEIEERNKRLFLRSNLQTRYSFLSDKSQLETKYRKKDKKDAQK